MVNRKLKTGNGYFVSILLPYRNAESTLEECLDSIRSQTLVDYELLAIDDHSTDDSLALLTHYAAADHRIKLFHNPGQGLVAALNHGLCQASTPLIARMDADDRMRPERLQLQYTHLQQHPETTLLGCGTRLFPDHEIRSGLREYVRWQNQCNQADRIADEIYIEAPFAHPSVMFRKEAILRVGGYLQGDFPEDYELWLRLHQAGHRMEKLSRTLLEWRDYPTRTSRIDPRYSRAAFDALRAGYLASDPRLLSRRGEFVIWGAGRKTRLRCRHLLEKGFTPRAWIDIDPRKIGNSLQGVPVVAPHWLVQGDKYFVLIYVANHGAREIIARELQGLGYQRGSDYLVVG